MADGVNERVAMGCGLSAMVSSSIAMVAFGVGIFVWGFVKGLGLGIAAFAIVALPLYVVGFYLKPGGDDDEGGDGADDETAPPSPAIRFPREFSRN